MLTLLDAVSVAGSRAKQNDDAFGWSEGRFWVIDGATDLHDEPRLGAASDASWLAHNANRLLPGMKDKEAADALRAVAAALKGPVDARLPNPEGWRRPAASLLMADVEADGCSVLDLGDCRLFTLDADGAAHAVGGPEDAADNEARYVVAATGGKTGDTPLNRADVIEELRRHHEKRNAEDGWWVFAADPRCVDFARANRVTLKRPAFLLAATDGFAALVDRYAAFDAAGLVRAALADGLSPCVEKLRAIERADPGGAAHPRWKQSDDATAMLMRLT